MDDSRRAGLALGPQTRTRRAELRRAIAEGRVTVPALVAGESVRELEEVALGMTVEQLVRAIPGVGDAGLEAILDTARLAGHKRLSALPHQRRRELAAAIRSETEG